MTIELFFSIFKVMVPKQPESMLLQKYKKSERKKKERLTTALSICHILFG